MMTFEQFVRFVVLFGPFGLFVWWVVLKTDEDKRMYKFYRRLKGGRWAFYQGYWCPVRPAHAPSLANFLCTPEGVGPHWSFEGITVREDYTNGKRLLCRLGWHKWTYIENEHGGRPMHRACDKCKQQQTWNYDLAREHGIIQWENYPVKSGRVTKIVWQNPPPTGPRPPAPPGPTNGS